MCSTGMGMKLGPKITSSSGSVYCPIHLVLLLQASPQNVPCAENRLLSLSSLLLYSPYLTLRKLTLEVWRGLEVKK